MDEQYIKTELKKFDITEASIAELNERYKDLTIKGIDDTEGYKAVRSARIVMKTYRVDVDKRRKELNEDALEFQRAINSEAKRITALLSPIENYLAEQEKSYDVEKERIRKEKEEAEALALQLRVSKLTELGFRLTNNVYQCTYMPKTFLLLDLKNMPDEMFNRAIADIEIASQESIERELKAAIAAKEKQAREDAERQAEQARLNEQRIKLEEIAKKQEALEAALKAEANRIEQEKKKLSIITETHINEPGGGARTIDTSSIEKPSVIQSVSNPVPPKKLITEVRRELLINEDTINDCIAESIYTISEPITDSKIQEILRVIDDQIDDHILDFIHDVIKSLD